MFQGTLSLRFLKGTQKRTHPFGDLFSTKQHTHAPNEGQFPFGFLLVSMHSNPHLETHVGVGAAPFPFASALCTWSSPPPPPTHTHTHQKKKKKQRSAAFSVQQANTKRPTSGSLAFSAAFCRRGRSSHCPKVATEAWPTARQPRL